MITLSVVKIKVKNKSYILSRKDLEQVRSLLNDVYRDSSKEMHKELTSVLASSHALSNRVKYTLQLDEIKLEDGAQFHIYSIRHKLSISQAAHMIKMVQCAINAPNTMIVLPDYIVVSENPPPEDLKLPQPKKRKKKDDPDSGKA